MCRVSEPVHCHSTVDGMVRWCHQDVAPDAETLEDLRAGHMHEADAASGRTAGGHCDGGLRHSKRRCTGGATAHADGYGTGCSGVQYGVPCKGPVMLAHALRAVHSARRAGMPYPWSNDPILNRYQFLDEKRALHTTTACLIDAADGMEAKHQITLCIAIRYRGSARSSVSTYKEAILRGTLREAIMQPVSFGVQGFAPYRCCIPKVVLAEMIEAWEWKETTPHVTRIALCIRLIVPVSLIPP